jgi:BNR/Asp-box repeat protein
MPGTRHVRVKSGDVLVLVGTMKGAFVFRADRRRRQWEMGGPHFPGQPVYSLSYDGRSGKRLWAGPESPFYGPALRYSDDFGRTWSDPKSNALAFPKDTGASLKRIWQIQPGRAEEPKVLFCGVEPAALFQSRDGGRSWSLERGLWEHPHRPRWQPGGGGLCLHTILPHPRASNRLMIAISSAGVYRTDDAGRTWRTSHSGVRAQFLPDPHPEFGQCVHKIARDATRPERLFLQNHWGLYRSDDDGQSWSDVANGVPSDFGFAMATHPRAAATAYIVPLESDQYRCMPQGKLRLFRTRNAGKTWRPLTRGLPQKGALETVLRDALATDKGDPAGVYFGTRSGKLYASRDDGDSWKLVHDGLPPVVCVKTATIGDEARRRA